jgi:hypothetical protein
VTLLDRVRARLAESEIAHALIGAAALAAHGVSRSTLDQDLLVTDRAVLDAGFWASLREWASVDVRTGDADDPLAGVVRISAPPDRDIDIVVGRHAWQDDILARAVPVGEEQLPIAQPADLILLKLYAGGSQDRWDIEQLLALSDSSLVRAVDTRVDRLPTASREIWAALRGHRES